MQTYTVAELAKLAGISVRALHHYDAIGLLKPRFVGENRYRHYGPNELLRLQQILLHREMDVPLAEIGAILDDPAFDPIQALRRHRNRVAAAADRYADMLTTIDKTIEKLQGDRQMKDNELYRGIVSPEKQAEYERWLIDRYGGDMPEQIAKSRKRHADMSEAERAEVQEELRTLETSLADAMKNGVPPQALALDPLLGRHRDWIALMWDRPCPPEAYSGMAEMYLAHPDFVARYEAIAPGFSDYLPRAMKAWAKRQSA